MLFDYSAPCAKDTGFFFVSTETAAALVSLGRCSEMDILLDLFLNAIYNDSRVKGSDIAPVAYFRNLTGNPTVAQSQLALRWNLPKTTVHRCLQKLQKLGHISLFNSCHGTVIYLRHFMDVMFQLCDVAVDKEELAMSLSAELPQDAYESTPSSFCVLKRDGRVPKMNMERVRSKTAQLLAMQGVPCFSCPRAKCILSQLSGLQGEKCSFAYQVQCPHRGGPAYQFEIQVCALKYQPRKEASV